jgi:hypothetical protein
MLGGLCIGGVDFGLPSFWGGERVSFGDALREIGTYAP